jgi:uncharacterized protein (DUF2147 family)
MAARISPTNPSETFRGMNFRSVCAAFCLIFAAISGVQAAEPVGTWLTQDGDAHIRISKCEAKICGTIVWLREAVDPATGKPPVDKHNPDSAKRNRRIQGITIFAMSPDDSGAYDGSIYNTDDGGTYHAKITLQSADRLEIKGCAGPFCSSEVWTRVAK